jgi:hypothetical protein
MLSSIIEKGGGNIDTEKNSNINKGNQFHSISERKGELHSLKMKRKLKAPELEAANEPSNMNV